MLFLCGFAFAVLLSKKGVFKYLGVIGHTGSLFCTELVALRFCFPSKNFKIR